MGIEDFSDDYPFQQRAEVANAYIQKIGFILPFFTSPVRAICSSQSILKTTDPQVLQNFAVASTLTSIKVSPSITNRFRLAANELYEEYLHDLHPTGISSLFEILNLLDPSEIIGVLSVTYFYKLLRKTCDEEEFYQLAPTLSLQLKHGGEEGSKINEAFGRGRGMAASGIRVLAFAVMMKANLKAYKKLRRQVNSDGQILHIEMELEAWGCTHLDVASALIGKLGFGSGARAAYMALQSNTGEALSAEAQWWLTCLQRTETSWKALKASGKKVFGDHFTPTDSADSLEGCRWLWQTASVVAERDPIISSSASIVPQADEIQPLTDETPFQYETSPVLIVEDEAVSQKILDNLFKSFKNKTIVGSGEEALELITKRNAEGNPFELALLDVSLPGISGIELLQQIRAEEAKGAKGKPCKIMMVTSAESPSTVVEAFNEGADAYVTKPVHTPRLAAELEKIGLLLDPEVLS